MRIELTMLGWTLVLAIVHIFAAAQARTRQYGAQWNMGARDETLPPPAPMVGRLTRAEANLYETLPLFATAVLAAAIAGRLDGGTALGAQLYFWGRLVYLPIYAAGIRYLRTVVFMVSMIGLVMILWGLLAG